MATSMNGWPVILQSDAGRLRRWKVPGVPREFTLRDGSAGFLLIWFVMFWHQRIDRVGKGIWDEWGWAVRPVRGQTSGYSNHASATAADVDATQHPMGVSIWRTFNLAEIIAIRWVIRVRLRHVLEWGGEWERADGMHIELNKSLAVAERVARRLMKTPRGRAILEANPGAKRVILS